MRVFKYVFLTFIILVEKEVWTNFYEDWILEYSYYDYYDYFVFNTTVPPFQEETFIFNTMSPTVQNDCFNDTTATYGGKVNTIRFQHTCLRWDSSLIPVHERFQDTDFPMDGSVQQANNYCRDPNNSGDLWCYTTNPEVKKDMCMIDKCEPTGESSILAEFEDDVWSCRHPKNECMVDEQLVCSKSDGSYTTTIMEEDCLMNLCCYKRGCIDIPSLEYAGRWSHSVSDYECLRWDTITATLNASLFPDGSIADANNYCRDPEHTGLPYCFVEQDFTQFCGIPTCSELASRHKYSHDCYTPTLADRNGLSRNENELCQLDPDRIVIDTDELRDKYPGCRECSCCQIQKCYTDESQKYSGTWSRTKSGRECRNWAELGMNMNPENYCRDSHRFGYTFCFTKDFNIELEECNLKIECPDNSTSSQVTQGHTNPMLRQTTATEGYGSSEITSENSHHSTKMSFAWYSSTSESRVEQDEVEWPPSKAHAKQETISFLFSLMLSLHLF